MLNNTKGVSLLSAPSVTTQLGLKANTDIVREFPYPIRFDPAFTATQSGKPPRTIPPTPTDFVTKDVGISSEITPTLDEDKIQLECHLRIIDFDGFTETNQLGKMPAFSTREVNLVEEFGKDDILKGTMVPGVHFEEPIGSDNNPSFAGAPIQPKAAKKRLIVFLSARSVPSDVSATPPAPH